MDSQLAIYPTARKVEALLKDQSRSGARLGYRVKTFPQLVDDLWQEYGGAGAILSATGERIAMEQALRESSAAREHELPLSAGVIECLHGVVREFKSAAIAPEDLRGAVANRNDQATRRIAGIASIFSRYEALLRRADAMDPHDREMWALRNLLNDEAAGRRPRYLDGVKELLVAEIYDFSLLQFMIVAALIRIIGDAKLTIQAEPHQVSASRFAELTWNRFVGEESIGDKVLPDFVRREGRPGRLGFVLQNLFVETDAPCPAADDTIRVIAAPNRRREIEEVARAIRRYIERRGPGIRLDRIAILARDLAPYEHHLRHVFSRYRIPLNLRDPRPVAAQAPGRLVLDLLEIPLAGYRRESLEHLIASPLIDVAAQRHDSMLREVGYMDRRTRSLAECVAQRRRDLDRALTENASDPGLRERLEGSIARLGQAAAAFSELLARFETLEAPATIANHASRLRAILRGLDLRPPQILDESAAAGFAALERVLDDLERSSALVAADRATSLEEFAALLEDVLANTAPDSAAQSRNAVQALEVLDARGLDFDLVFVIGLHDGGFPIYRSEDPILPDEIRLALNPALRAALRRRFGAGAPDAPGRILRTRRDRNSEDWFLFFLALSTAERQVVLSYPITDEGGIPLATSPFAAAVLELIGRDGTGGVPERPLPEQIVPRSQDCFTREEFLNRAAADGALEAPPTFAIPEKDRLESIVRRIGIERRRNFYLSLPIREFTGGESDPRKLSAVDSFNGRTNGSDALRDFLLGTPDAPRKWSASQFNELAACGFRFFSARVLKLREEEELDYEPSAPETGSLVHRLLHELAGAIATFSDRDAALANARALLTRIYAVERANARDPAFFDLEWRNIDRIVEEFIDFEAEAARSRPHPEKLLLEHPFRFVLRDRDSGSKTGTDLTIEGRTDRLELYRDEGGGLSKLCVLDYKTSRYLKEYRKRADPNGDEFGVTEFQLPIYLMGALAEFGDQLEPRLSLEAGYLILRSPDKLALHPVPRQRVDPDPERRARIAGDEPGSSIADRMIDLARSAIEGRFDVDALQCDDYCPFRNVCRYDKPRGAAQPSR